MEKGVPAVTGQAAAASAHRLAFYSPIHNPHSLMSSPLCALGERGGAALQDVVERTCAQCSSLIAAASWAQAYCHCTPTAAAARAAAAVCRRGGGHRGCASHCAPQQGHRCRHLASRPHVNHLILCQCRILASQQQLAWSARCWEQPALRNGLPWSSSGACQHWQHWQRWRLFCLPSPGRRGGEQRGCPGCTGAMPAYPGQEAAAGGGCMACMGPVGHGCGRQRSSGEHSKAMMAAFPFMCSTYQGVYVSCWRRRLLEDLEQPLPVPHTCCAD